MRKYIDMILLHSTRMADSFGQKFVGLSQIDRAVALTLADVYGLDLIRVQHDMVITTIKIVKVRKQVALKARKLVQNEKGVQQAAQKARKVLKDIAVEDNRPVKILTQPKMKLLPITQPSEDPQDELGDVNTFGYCI